MSRRPFPHEIAALLFCMAAFFVLENLPVTYPRSALLFAYAWPMAMICALALVCIALRRRRNPEALRFEALETVRACIPLMFVMATSFVVKSFIYLINRRVWDPVLLEVDRWLHFGFSPTIFLVTLFGERAFLAAIDLFYSGIYYFVFFGGTAVLLAFLPAGWRLRFAAAFTMMWILGSVLYVVMPSWGPAFSATAIVEEALHSMPLTVRVQSQLYRELSSLVRAPLAPRAVIFGSVAAFPSLHVGVVTLFALASRRLSRPLFLFTLLLVLAMLIGSVVTGYHFLIDGYAGALLAAVGWFIAAKTIPLPSSRSPQSPGEPARP